MHYALDDTIAAIASAPGGSPRGILRLSGPDVVRCLENCFRAESGGELRSVARATVVPGWLRVRPPIGELPGDLYLWPDRRSYTRQPTAEFHTLGSPPLLAAALRTVCEAGARLASPGEFTLRAFLAGRLDLTQAEAVLGVIDAVDRHELDVALAQLAGGLASPLRTLRERLLDLLAHLEAGLDFGEEDIQFISPEELDSQLQVAIEAVQQLAEQMESRGQADGEFRVVLRGWPNVGKSSLLNALAGDDVAIVSPIAGTTRDYVTRRIELDGQTCWLIDTAGVESVAANEPTIGSAAQQMTASQTSAAHLELLCLDGSRPLNDWESAELQRPSTAERLVVVTKTDLAATPPPVAAVGTSAVRGVGLDSLRAAIAERLRSSLGRSEVVAGTADRCRDSLRLAAESLGRARETARAGWGEELVAAELRVSLEELGKVSGAVYTDDVLDRIFRRFCIGK